MLAPLSSGGSVLGALVLGDKLSGEMFTSDDASFLEILCGEAAVCVRNALLFDDRNQRVRELSALNTLSWALGRDTQFDAVLERALNQVMQVTDGEAGSIMLVEPDGRTLRIGTARGLPSEIVQSTCVQMGRVSPAGSRSTASRSSWSMHSRTTASTQNWQAKAFARR